MPTKRRRVAHRLIEPQTPIEVWARLMDDPLPEGGNAALYELPRDGALEDAWQRHGDEVTQTWARRHPGRRPWCWWSFEAPRQPLGTWPGCYYDGTLQEPRIRFGGKGTPAFEALNYVPSFSFGYPVHWVNDWWIDCRGLQAEHFDVQDPPRFESQAAYLERHGLLLEGELRRLKSVAFQPVVLPQAFWPAG